MEHNFFSSEFKTGTLRTVRYEIDFDQKEAIRIVEIFGECKSSSKNEVFDESP